MSGKMVDEIIEEVWKESWRIVRASKAYKESYPLKTAKPMIETLFKTAMVRFYEKIEKEGDYVLVPLDVAQTIVWNHIWRVKCKDCNAEYDYDAVGFLHYLDNGRKCDECGSSNTEWGVVL